MAGTRYRDIVFIGNRKSLSAARTKAAAVTRTRAGRKARDIVSRASESSRFLRPFPLAFKRAAGPRGREKRSGRGHLRTNVDLYPE